MPYILRYRGDDLRVYFFDGKEFTTTTADRAARFPDRATAEKFALRWATWPYDSRNIRPVVAPMPAEEHSRFPKGRWS